MSFNLKSLELTERYELDVTVDSGSGKFFGKLYLSPKKSTITIMGETSEGRECSIGFDDIDILVCYDMDKTFLLHNLHCVYSSVKAIEQFPKLIGFFEYKYNIDFVIFSPYRTDGIDCISSLSIHSESIEKWIGYTENQEKILQLNDKKESIFKHIDIICELMVKIKNNDILGINYNWEMEGGYNKFKTGLSFHPCLFKAFHERLSSDKLKEQYITTYNLISFFYGGDIVVDRIEIGIEFYNRCEKGSLYFSSKHTWPKYPRDYPFYPLGKDLKFDIQGYPAIPVKSFSKYFSLPKKEFGYFGKYIKYKRMDNVEEKYLGFFRLLESLCYQKKTYLDESELLNLCDEYKNILIQKFGDKKSVTSFLKRIPKLNESKYNTEKCIQEFYNLMPNTLRNSWVYKKSDIGGLCNLRNDITHANDYYVDEKEMEKKTKFIEVLLILFLLSKIDILPEVGEKLIHRVSGYYLINNQQ